MIQKFILFFAILSFLSIVSYAQEIYNPIDMPSLEKSLAEAEAHTEDFSSPDQYKLETPQYARGLASQMYYEEEESSEENIQEDEMARSPQALETQAPKKKIRRPSAIVERPKIPKGADAADLHWTFEAEQ